MQFALRHARGVDCAHVDFEAQTATVICNGACDRDALVAALRNYNIGGTIR